MKSKLLIIPKKELKLQKKAVQNKLPLEKMISYRIRFFAFIIFIVMALILGQAYFIQILNSEYYSIKLFNQTTKKNTSNSLRGIIYDRNGEILVGNRQRLNIVYDGSQKIEIADLTKNIVDSFDIELHEFSEEELNEMVLFFHKENQGFDVMSGFQLNTDRCLDESSDSRECALETLTEDQKRYFQIYQILKNASTVYTNLIKEDITIEEAAFFLEHRKDFEGLSLEFDWERDYPEEVHLRSLFGRVSSANAGIFEENLLSYLAKGYSQKDKIGVSGLEYVYEDLLKGKKKISSVSMNESGELINQVIETGERGYDLTLALNMKLEKKVEEITQELLERERNNQRRIYMNQILVVVMDPNNGDVLCMVSMNRSSDGSYYNDASQTYVQAFVPGSVVKGATLYMGLDQGVVRPDEVMMDEPLKLANSPSKASWKNLGAINDIQALAFSSNVYMMKIALRIAGTRYVYNGGLTVKDGTFDLMRSYYNSFGLGILTQADVYREQIGYIGDDSKDGNILDYVIGQYDTVTTLELAQYISTIANGGKRLKPRIMLNATLPSQKNVVYTNDVTILNILENQEAIRRVQQGFRACVTDGLCSSLQSAPQQIAAKTGTAEAYLQVENGEGKLITVPSPNNSVIAYAPYETPEVAIACMIPHAWNGEISQSNLCLEVVERITEFIFN